MADQPENMINPDPASDGTPLDAVVFSRLMNVFGPFEDRPKIAVAVSGGADSMALALLAHEWCGSKGGELTAITVDHGLRAEAAEEAIRVGEQLRKHGIDHRILRWDGAKPQSGIQEAARKARYDLLDHALGEMGILHLLVAHHRDDQRETLVMRQQRESGVIGRAGMAARRYLRNTRLLRPLLPVTKADLIATLRARQQDWIEDPSNRNVRFERVRIRHDPMMDGPKKEMVQSGADARQTAEYRIADLLASAVQIANCGIARIDYSKWQDVGGDEVTARYALGHIVRVVGGENYMPALGSLMAALLQINEKEDARVSLGGCVLHRRGGILLVYREIGRVDAHPVRIDPGLIRGGFGQRWDNRFELFFADHGAGVTADYTDLGRFVIAPLSACDAFHTRAFRAAIGKIAPFVDHLPRAALASIPALYDKEVLHSVGGLEVSGISDVLSAAGCRTAPIGVENAIGMRWRFAPPTPLWESGFKSSPKPDVLLA
ncbi:tRNA lysidine(34) synthetase TilS [Thalassospira sp. MCCC 1A03138]|uniref:tRNA lysidine(34) synthetase TilS n=1 Tax=Thalassospira sp. MCCC 1A03138 TaxID=1470576 RepID=UPI00143E096E|nr:tRNA lysidine(34) synthetase TilS [Thalassospira sp. MCCC 1A03138]